MRSLLFCALVFLLLVIAVFFGIRRNSNSEVLDNEVSRVVSALRGIGASGGSFAKEQLPDGTVRNCIEIAPTLSVNDDNIYLLSNLNSVYGINLSDAQITSHGLVRMRNCPDLRYLQLARTKIDDEAFRELNVHDFPNLEALDLSDTRITQSSSKYLERFPKLKLVCAAGTSLTSIKNVKVDRDAKPISWRGIKFDPEWERKGWDLALER